jgi:5-methylcytosine-specific restriction endonuclease McrA
LRWRTENPEKESSRKHRWRASNQHVQDAATRRWRENNAEQRAETSRLWRERNKDRHDEATKRWRANNPERQKETARLHKSRLEYRVRHAERQRARRAQGYIPLDEYLAWLDAQPRTCFYCDGDCASEYHIDHFVPLALGGWHALSNLTVACPGCNLRKGAKDPLDFMQEMRCANHPNDNDP